MCQLSSLGAGSNCELHKKVGMVKVSMLADDLNKCIKFSEGLNGETKAHSQFDMVMNCLLVHVINIIIYLHYRCLVTASVAIVGSRENSHHCSIMLPLISLHHKLMCSCDKVKIVDMGELFCDILPERVPSTSWRNSPTTPFYGSHGHKTWSEKVKEIYQ